MLISRIKQKLRGIYGRLTPAPDYRGEFVKALGKGDVMGRHRINVQIQTISTCNANCYFCPYIESWQKKNPGVMKDELYRRIIDEISPYKLGKFCPYFDEPLMDRKLFDRIEYAASRLDFDHLEISTNAELLDAKKLADLVRVFPKIKHEIWVSFHGVDKDTHQAIMGIDYERCMENILALVDAAQTHNLNILIRGAGAPRLGDSRLPKWFGREDYENFWKAQFNKRGFKKEPRLFYFTYHDRAGSINRNEINFNCKARDLKDFYCTRFDQWLHFLYTGEMILCCMDYHRETVFGDITKHSLNEILKSDGFLNTVRCGAGLSPSPDNFICKRCVSPGG